MSVITLKKLNMSNMFGYGSDNSFVLNKNKITQLTAVNGSGKSTIALIIQEILFNKNVKSIKKGDILNRYVKDKTWKGSLYFSVDDDEYCMSVSRTGASTKAQLIKNDEDISEHKLLDTYKKLQSILGLDFEIFSQITYQSSTDLLDFLKATDTNRKKFLINLFNLQKYIEIGDKIKVLAAECDKELQSLTSDLKSVEHFLSNNKIPSLLEEVEVIDVDSELLINISDLDKEIASIKSTCAKIDSNMMYILERNSIKFDVSLQEPSKIDEAVVNKSKDIQQTIVILRSEIAAAEKTVKTVNTSNSCNTCGQPIDNSHQVKIKEDAKAAIESKKAQIEELLKVKKELDVEIKAASDALYYWQINQKAVRRFEDLTQLIDETIPNKYPDHTELSKAREETKLELVKQQKAFKEANDYNKQVSANNSKVETLIEQESDFIIRQKALNDSILDKSSQVAKLGILKKAFSPSGIVAFKLENLTKRLEESINKYLSVLSDGQFQVEFTLDKEKLNINIVNNGIVAPIETTSNGEFSRIQTAVLLAVRKLLSDLGDSKINLLFLDEITGVLDTEGKEKLIEILLESTDINVFLISHDFTHPLIDKVQIIKNDNISSIQN